MLVLLDLRDLCSPLCGKKVEEERQKEEKGMGLWVSSIFYQYLITNV